MSAEGPINDLRAKVKREYSSLWGTEEFQEALDEYGTAFLIFLYGTWAASYGSDVEELVSLFEEFQIECFNSEEEWANTMADRLDIWASLDEDCRYSQYLVFDWEGFVRNAQQSGEFAFWDTEDGVYVHPNF